MGQPWPLLLLGLRFKRKGSSAVLKLCSQGPNDLASKQPVIEPN